jgi:dimethylhistidine N-methyltransferase
MFDATAHLAPDLYPNAIAAEALAGLMAQRKTLPAKLFYDEEGCRLFGEITALPEYYLTRTELRLLRDTAGDLSEMMPPGLVLVEYGASDEAKAEIVLRSLVRPAAYVPIDIAGPALAALEQRMRRRHPRLAIYPIAADFLTTLVLPPFAGHGGVLGFFPGSTIGNLEPAAARCFLAQVRRTLGPSSAFLVGVDLRKDPSVLVPAYDDQAGVTAAFNRNLLVRLNREAGADFDLGAFSHRAVWNDAESRIEMHLVSHRDQIAHVAGYPIRFREGETIHTENSYKHTEPGFAALAHTAGWDVRHVWTDIDRLFSLHLLSAGP